MKRILRTLSFFLILSLLISFCGSFACTAAAEELSPDTVSVSETPGGGGDPENPAWHITPECYDYEESDLPVTVWLVSVYAHDGSICGYREVNGAG